MNPHSGVTFRLGDDLFGDASAIGDSLDMAMFREAVVELGDRATGDERAAMYQEALVRVSDDVAQKLALGERERIRRRRRRKAAAASRRANR